MIQSNNNCEIRIDKGGIWYCNGGEMKRQDIVQYFYQHLKRDNDGNYLIEIGNDFCIVSVEDAPYVIRSVAVSCSKNDGQQCIVLSLTDGSSEELNHNIPLWTGSDNVMYCRVKRGEYVARFSRSAYYHLCEYAEYDTEREQYFINLINRSYPIMSIKQP
jgi:hypothetical protein